MVVVEAGLWCQHTVPAVPCRCAAEGLRASILTFLDSGDVLGVLCGLRLLHTHVEGPLVRVREACGGRGEGGGSSVGILGLRKGRRGSGRGSVREHIHLLGWTLPPATLGADSRELFVGGPTQLKGAHACPGQLAGTVAQGVAHAAGERGVALRPVQGSGAPCLGTYTTTRHCHWAWARG